MEDPILLIDLDTIVSLSDRGLGGSWSTSNSLKAARLLRPCTFALMANLSFPCRDCHRFEEEDEAHLFKATPACTCGVSGIHRVCGLAMLRRLIEACFGAKPNMYFEPLVGPRRNINVQDTIIISSSPTPGCITGQMFNFQVGSVGSKRGPFTSCGKLE